MSFGEFCLTSVCLILGATLLTTICAFLVWLYDDWKKNRRDW